MRYKLLVLFAMLFVGTTNAQTIDYNSLPLAEKIKFKERDLGFTVAKLNSGHDQIMTSPEQDCNSAIPVCQNVYNQPVSYSGYGNTQEVPSSSCLGNQEKNSVWYIFTVSASGSLIFQITPVSSSDDYDFALYNITGNTCAGVTNGSAPEVNCNFSATAGNTGLASGQTNTSQPASGTNQNAPVNVTVGQTYVLVVSNYSSTQSGYSLNFGGGTASIFDNIPPTPQSVFAPCGATNLTLQMSEAVTCASTAANGSDITIAGPGGPFTVSSAAGVNCGSSSSQVNVNFTPALQTGQTYTLTVLTGTDGNTLIDNCGNPTAVNSQVTFSVSPPAGTISGPTSICKGSSLSLTASAGSSYSWAPGGMTTQTINVSPTTNTTYTCTIGNGTCGNQVVTHAVTVKPSPAAGFTFPSPLCAGQVVNFTNTTVLSCSIGGIGAIQCNCGSFGCSPTAQNLGIYLWTYGDGGTGGFSTGQSGSHTYAAAGTYTVTLQVNDLFTGCSNTIHTPITILPGAGPLVVSHDTTVCPGQPVTMSVSGGSTYSWTSTPAGFTSTSATPTVAPAVTTTYSVSTPGCGGSITAQVVVTIGGTPPTTSAITGPSPICPNATGQIYSVTNTPGSTYAWTVPAGATITAGQGTNSITVNFGATAGTISVTETASCGTGTPVSKVVTIGSAPVTSAITGPSPVCPNATGQIYSVTNNAPNTYAWTIPAGASITGGQGTNSITVNFGASGGTISVTETSSCGTGTPVTLNVVTSATPVTSSITGPTPVCANATGQVYTVTNNPPNTYNWSVPAGATITAGQGTNTITVDFGATAGTISVTETSTCGSGTPVTINVTNTTIPPVTAPITGPSPVCPNAVGQVYSVASPATDTYAWTVPAGATITAGQGTNTITVDFGATGGTIGVTETSSCGVGTPVTLNVTTSSTPVTSAITGPSPVCPNATAQTYSVANTTGSTYAWSVPAGATIVSGQGTNSITVNFGAIAGTISVTETATCGAGAPVTLNVANSALPVTSTITGPATVCPNATAQTFSVTNNPPNTYTWTVPAGATIAAGQGTNTITVTFAGTSGNVTVTETNACGAGTPATLAVAVTAVPPVTSAITGPSPVCPNATAQVYSVTNTNPNTYAWTVPAGATIVSGQGTSSITVNFGATAGTISVTETSSCGVGTPVNLNVTNSALPVTSTITGPTAVCANATAQTYSVTNNPPNTYSWTVPAGASIVSGQTTNSITVNFGATPGTISVTETNTCGAGTAVTQNITFNPLPTTSVITGTTPVCANAVGTYSVTNTAPNTYNWTVPAGASVTTGQGTNSVTVTFGSTSGNVSVTETNTCGNGTPVTFAVVVNSAPPMPVITGAATVCQNSTANAYSVVNTVGNTYNWAVTGGLTIASGQGTNAVTVNAATTNGTISVTESNTCGASPAATLNVTATVVVVSVTPASASVCNGFSTSLTASGATSYAWSPGAGLSSTTGATVNAGPSTATTYVVTGVTGTCVGTASVTVSMLPDLVITPVATSASICTGTSTSITASGASTYSWAGVGLSSTTGATVSASPGGTQTYTVTGSTATCSGTATITLTVTPVPTLNLTPANPTICYGASANIIASGATTYAWAPNTNFISNNAANSDVTVNPLSSTTYTVIGTLGNCNNSTAVSVTVLPQIIPNAGVDDTICSGQSVQLVASGGAAYSWLPSASLNSASVFNPIASPTGTTTYTVTASNGGGQCSQTDVVTIHVDPIPTVNAGLDTSINIEESVLLHGITNGTVYSWANDGTLSCSICLNTIATPVNATTYTLTAYNVFGCSNSDVVHVEVIKDYAYYIPNAFSPNGDNLNEVFAIEGYGIEKMELTIFDRWGNKLFTTAELYKGWNGEYKGDTVQADEYVYTCKIHTYSGSNIKKTGRFTVVR